MSVGLGDVHVTLDTSPPLLAQLLDVLVDNAFAYSQPGTSVIVRATADADRVTIDVQDHGIGISDADRPRIFEPFFRAADARRVRAAGSGLGLAIVARLATALAATVHCDSAPGKGSTFSVSLPRRRTT